MRDNDTSLEGEVIHNETHQDSPVKKPDTTMAMVNYGLYLASFLVGFSMFVGVIIAYVYRGKGPAWLDEHYRYQIRTFWIGCVYGCIALVLTLALVGFLLFFALAAWIIIRCVIGFKALQEQRAPANVDTWLI
ncbi:MAG: DUF4870 family protein [Halomonadaceae bacterium]|uniref:DUF4870 domain-containing protein n=1 Tax=Halomonas colorata TaxID=2742615 RepID=A0ABR9FYR8_9GAMM|nr:DUF4870 domain-containing protein [Halomonas colorata]MBE0463815.1 hypothetical protein [Halomonas colorata]